MPIEYNTANDTETEGTVTPTNLSSRNHQVTYSNMTLYSDNDSINNNNSNNAPHISVSDFYLNNNNNNNNRETSSLTEESEYYSARSGFNDSANSSSIWK
jgi:hypothetical protein